MRIFNSSTLSILAATAILVGCSSNSGNPPTPETDGSTPAADGSAASDGATTTDGGGATTDGGGTTESDAATDGGAATDGESAG